MANYHLEVTAISRKKNRSVTRLVSYIVGTRLHNSYKSKTYNHSRHDVIYHKVFLPINAPPSFRELQCLCDEIEIAENRWDARTAREFKGSLPNELTFQELIQIVSEFVNINFVERGLCAISAIHEGRNELDPSRNNPHAHIVVSMRTVGPDGFDKKKYREHDRRFYINVWREQWAAVQNRAYERNRLDIRVSHESLEVQGKDREPAKHLSLPDWQREKRGEHTRAGDIKREIEARNKERARQQQIKRKYSIDHSR